MYLRHILCTLFGAVAFLSFPIQPFSSEIHKSTPPPISTPMVGGGRGLSLPLKNPLQYHWPWEGVGPETHKHKITSVPLFYGAWT